MVLQALHLGKAFPTSSAVWKTINRKEVGECVRYVALNCVRVLAGYVSAQANLGFKLLIAGRARFQRFRSRWSRRSIYLRNDGLVLTSKK